MLLHHNKLPWLASVYLNVLLSSVTMCCWRLPLSLQELDPCTSFRFVMPRDQAVNAVLSVVGLVCMLVVHYGIT